MGLKRWIERIANYIQQYDAITGKIPTWLVVLVMSALPSGTAIATFFSNWTMADIWLASLGTGFVALFAFVGVQLGLAKAEEIRRGPPPPKPEPPRVVLHHYGGRDASVRIHNQGGSAKLRATAKLDDVSKGRVVQSWAEYSLTYDFECISGDDRTVRLATMSDQSNHVWLVKTGQLAGGWSVSSRNEITITLAVDVFEVRKDAVIHLETGLYKIVSDVPNHQLLIFDPRQVGSMAQRNG